MTEPLGVLSTYTLLEELGRGGFARVYRAHDSRLDRDVALKVLHGDSAGDEDFKALFEQEARSAARLRHGNIVVIYDLGEADGRLYIAMELLPGRDLEKRVREEGPFDLERAAAVVEQIAAALDFAHSQGVVHRDVKSANIIVDDNGHATLTDFGLVRALAASTVLSSQLGAYGSRGVASVMAPEQTKPNAVVDARTDVYALGIVAHEMLAGRLPFQGDDPFGVSPDQRSAAPPRPGQVNGGLPCWVEEVVLTALATDPAARYQTAGEFAGALRQAVESARREAEVDGRRQQAEAAYRRGVDLHDEGMYGEAILHFDRAIEIDPHNAEHYHGRGISRAWQGDHERALADYDRAITLDPTRSEYYYSRGYRHALNGDYGRAVADFDEAIRLDPTKALYYGQRGKSCTWRDDYDRAIADFDRAIHFDPANADYYWERGKSYTWKNDFDRAIADFDDAIRLDPGKADYYWQRGKSYTWKDDYDRAIADFDKAIQLNPKKAGYYWERGKSHTWKDDYARAIADFDKAIEIDPRKAEYYYMRGVSYRQKGDYDRAIADCGLAIALDPGNADYLYTRGLSYQVKGSTAKARADFQQAASLGHEGARKKLR
ncbi:MAG: tetratricopeptide repeat protein [Chloroflexi bacterium]|nr:tetratricopeptide repeat protein [Chloroflexota bacterium]